MYVAYLVTAITVIITVVKNCVTIFLTSGKNISCNGFEKFSEDFSQDYCWTQGLYTIKEAYDLPESQIPYPGIIPENVPACREHNLKNGGNYFYLHCHCKQ